TWQAYNKWPDEFSLYDSDPPEQPQSSRTWVSFDRPYGKYPQVVDHPLSQGSGEYLLWEFPLSFWLEKLGYDVTYCSNVDTHVDPEGLSRVKAFISVGHDEYWTLDMFNNVKNAVNRGLNVAFLSGNSIMWAIALDPSADLNPEIIDPRTGLTEGGKRIPVKPNSGGNPNRLMHRVGRFGGITPEEEETGIMGPFEGDFPNENTLIGARTVYPFNGSADWIVSKADHWIFEGTAMKDGDAIPGLVGWEFHGDPAHIPGLEIIAKGIPITGGGKESHYTATVYPGPKGNWVFNASTIFWSIGLSDPPGLMPPYSHHGRPHGPDERVQKITANFFQKCGIKPAADGTT
ncbi:MAG: N,N-dimethylformamidase beta subunit family domain-containing protein, partial [Acidobacteriota bacterium]